MLGESFVSPPIRLSGTELELKIAANSTYQKAKLLLYGIEQVSLKGRPVFGDRYFRCSVVKRHAAREFPAKKDEGLTTGSPAAFQVPEY